MACPGTAKKLTGYQDKRGGDNDKIVGGKPISPKLSPLSADGIIHPK